MDESRGNTQTLNATLESDHCVPPGTAPPLKDASQSCHEPILSTQDSDALNTESILQESMLPDDVRLAALERRVGELQAALEHRERQIEAMRRISDSLFVHSSIEALVRETLTLAIDVMEAEAGSLLLHDPVHDTLVFRYVVGAAAATLNGYAMPASQGIAGRVFKSGVPDLTEKASDRQEFNRTVDETTGYHTDSMMTVPVKRSEGAPIGVMQVLNATHSFDRGDLEVLEVLCGQAAAAIENAYLAQQARKAELVNVIGDISHDIKNMLTPIQTGVWTLGPLLDEMFEALDAIYQECPQTEPWRARVATAADLVRHDYEWILTSALDAADKVQARTKEIADAIKGESAPPVWELADLNETVQEIARALRLVAESSGIRLHLELDPQLPRAEFDRKQLYNALYNLVNNAIPETPEGGSVILRTKAPKSENDMVVVEVQDTGKGIPEHVRSRLFTDQAISTKPGGTGLGTRIVAGVVQRHHGTITVSSEADKGSTFTIRLPLRHPEI
ncbi:MAG: GAF domain-containing sensor histidine kinase [Abitibacteriaceae bacterium]|nr:GAF domain-containing sensor histidine kinase [Abditibacteriaceae bacterium]